MNSKDLSPAFLTSIAVIFVGALFIGSASAGASAFGWLLLLVGLGLNVFSAWVSIQRLKGGPLPPMLTGSAHEQHDEFIEVEEVEHEEQSRERRSVAASEPDTEEHPVITTEQLDQVEPSDEKIFRSSRTPRPRNR